MNGTAIGWLMGTLATAAALALAYAVVAWRIGVRGDCCPHDVDAR